jgi:beta-lactamase regulating signal transducer with metallopeptidase domain
MWVWIDRVGPILFDAALSTTIFLSAIVFAMLVCRQPSRRLLIARVALLASLAMIPLLALAPLPRFDLINTFVPPNPSHPSLTLEPDSIKRPASGAFLPDLVVNWPIPDDRQEYLALAGQWLPRGLALIDLACVGTGCAWLLLGFWGVRWLLRHSREPSPTTRELFDRLTAGDTRLRARPALRVSSRVQSPVVVGFLRPTILIPRSYDESNGDTELLRLSLLHEIAHAEQSDPWFGTVASLAQTVWFFVPQIWWIRSQLLIDQEFLADRSAALRYGTSSGYAATLLSLAESGPNLLAEPRPSVRGAIWPAVGKGGARSPLFQRILMLLYCPFRVEARAPRSWSWIWRLTVVAAAIVAACLCIRWPYALEHQQNGDLASGGQPFCVADFVAEPMVFLPGGRALPYILPVALPTQFELTVEVLANVTDLAKVHIAGHPLGVARLSPLVSDLTWSSSGHTESWHQVRLERHGQLLSIWVDGRKLPAVFNPQATSQWLCFEPSPERPTHFRNLIVHW